MSGRESIPVFHHVHAPRRNVLAPPRLPIDDTCSLKIFSQPDA
ncbi:MAG TPA: hypothetical protein VMD98_07760 [Bryocella sp.]|jgi:hypothetical protein|nr:hypothetical protein [Bryocella sp.]